MVLIIFLGNDFVGSSSLASEYRYRLAYTITTHYGALPLASRHLQ